MMIGAVLAGADDECVQAVEEIAAKVGMAFQIQDDILDVISTTEVLGKPVHSDEKMKNDVCCVERAGCGQTGGGAFVQKSHLRLKSTESNR